VDQFPVDARIDPARDAKRLWLYFSGLFVI
jgi:hypothetical protein